MTKEITGKEWHDAAKLIDATKDEIWALHKKLGETTYKSTWDQYNDFRKLGRLARLQQIRITRLNTSQVV